MEKIRVLQLGKVDWNSIYKLPQEIQLDHLDCFDELPQKPYDIFFLDRMPWEEEIEPLYQAVKTYTLFVTKRIYIDHELGSDRAEWLFQCKKATLIETRDVQQFLKEEAKYYYPKPYGEKFTLKDLAIAHDFSGMVRWNGSYSVSLEGEFGEFFHQVAFWRYNKMISKGQVLDFWLEYEKSQDVDINLTIIKFRVGSLSDILSQYTFDEKELKDVIQIDGDAADGNLFISLEARGNGKIQIIALHNRISRGRHGYFLPGGERYVASNREEAFCYFERET